MLIDIDNDRAEAGAELVNRLLNRQIACPIQADVKSPDELIAALFEVTSIISAVPYGFNPAITDTALQVKANMCDLGGNTAIVREQLKRNEEAKSAGITIVPDCGMGPGMNISLAVYAMSLVDRPREVYIWDGGLPQHPKQPWNYELTFNIGGLTNEYDGNAYFLRNGDIVEVHL